MSDSQEGKPISINIKTWQFVSTICTIILASIALATPWTKYTAQNALAPKIDAIEVKLNEAHDKSLVVEEDLSVTKAANIRLESATKDRLDRIDNKLDQILLGLRAK